MKVPVTATAYIQHRTGQKIARFWGDDPVASQPPTSYGNVNTRNAGTEALK